MNRYIYTIISVALFAISYLFNYNDHRDKLHNLINNEFKREAPNWGDSLVAIHRNPYSSIVHSLHLNKSIKAEAANEIYLPPKFHTKIDNDWANMLLIESSVYYISTTDSLFNNIVNRLGINADVATRVYAKSIFDMFISEDSININAPYIHTFQAKQIEGYTTDSVSLGICGQGKMIGTVNIPASEILKKMELLTKWQFVALALIALLYLVVIYLPKKRRYMQNVKFIGSTCIDFNTNTVYYWNGSKLSLTDKRAEVLKMFVDSAPEYKLLKEDICRRIWNRDSKDGQALYNVAMSELRSYLIAKDDCLELKTLTNEGVVLFTKRKHKFPLLHYISRIKEPRHK